MKHFVLLFTFYFLLFNFLQAQSFLIEKEGTFAPNKKVLLFKNSYDKKLILFKTNLRVNTDGIPISYHPFDLRGDSIALNTILNGVAIYRKIDNVKISNPNNPNKFSSAERQKMRTEAYTVFEKFRDSDFQLIPDGYIINWQSVLIPENKNGIKKPCVLKNGEYKGYFASATALTNELKVNRGECECNNQVNPFKIPTLVLAGGDNIVKQYGARVGDLLLAFNPLNKKLVYAIIGDIGPKDNLGEGSVILNMKLLNLVKFPKVRAETYKLSTKGDIIISIIPNTNNYRKAVPFSAENISNRITQWLKEVGFETENDFINFIQKNKQSL